MGNDGISLTFAIARLKSAKHMPVFALPKVFDESYSLKIFSAGKEIKRLIPYLFSLIKSSLTA